MGWRRGGREAHRAAPDDLAPPRPPARRRPPCGPRARAGATRGSVCRGAMAPSSERRGAWVASLRFPCPTRRGPPFNEGLPCAGGLPAGPHLAPTVNLGGFSARFAAGEAEGEAEGMRWPEVPKQESALAGVKTQVCLTSELILFPLQCPALLTAAGTLQPASPYTHQVSCRCSGWGTRRGRGEQMGSLPAVCGG